MTPAKIIAARADLAAAEAEIVGRARARLRRGLDAARAADNEAEGHALLDLLADEAPEAVVLPTGVYARFHVYGVVWDGCAYARRVTGGALVPA